MNPRDPLRGTCPHCGHRCAVRHQNGEPQRRCLAHSYRERTGTKASSCLGRGEICAEDRAEAPLPPRYTRFRDIPQLTRAGSWECDYELHRVWPFLEVHRLEQQLDLDPDFQRGHVWAEAQQVAWLEFFLRGGRTARVLYFNCPAWHTKQARSGDCNAFVIVDGKQRVEAIRRFVHNEVRVFGSHYSDYEDVPRVANTVRINVNDLPTRADVLRWYCEMNAGGTPHTAAELERVRQLLQAEETHERPT